MKKEIRELVEFALSDDLNQHKAIFIGKVTHKQAEVIKKQIGIDIYGCERYLDTNAIRHTIKNHGSAKDEEKRGQIAINIDDFENIPNFISKAKDVKYIGKNKLKQDVFQYTTEENGIVFIIEGVRINKHGNKIFIETMFKRKKVTEL